LTAERMHFVFRSFVVLTRDEIVDLLCHLESMGFSPKKYGQSSARPKHEYNPQMREDVAELCYDVGYISVKGDRFTLQISARDGYRKPLLHSLDMKLPKRADSDMLANVATTLFRLSKSCYSYVTLRTHKARYTPGRSIENCLFGFSWLNLFGQPYIDMWGEEKVLSAPAIITQHDDHIAIKLSASPLAPDHAIKEKSKELQLYFGEKYFYDREFENRQMVFKSIQEADEYSTITLDLANYLAPDFHRYYNYHNDDTSFYAVQKKQEKEILTDETTGMIVKHI
jgi:hypothetical protein